MNSGTLELIADPCGCDERTGIRNLVPVAAAIQKSLALAHVAGGARIVSLKNAVGRVLIDDLRTPFALPPFDNSAMDGYAICADDLSGDGPWQFKVTGRVAAGDNAAAAGSVGAGQAFRIFTGAGIPAGADTVIMQEHVEVTQGTITITDPPPRGACIRIAGEDAEQNSLLLPKGTLIGPPEVGAIAAIGLAEIRVTRKVRIALLCTGNELCEPGTPLAPGQIYNSNRFMLLAALDQPWARVCDLGALPDDPGALRNALITASQAADIVVTTGGVSVGEEDHVVAQLRHAGGDIEVMKIAMKPGKPLTIGTLNGAIFLGLPGNPVAAFMTWKILGAQVAAKMSGQNPGTAPPGVVVAAKSISRRPGRQEYRPARIVGVSACGHPMVEMLDSSFSAKIAMVCRSDGFAVIPAQTEKIKAGDHLDFVPI